MRSICKNSHLPTELPSKFPRKTLQHLVVVEKYKLIYCYIPKSASSTITKLILKLEGKNTTGSSHRKVVTMEQIKNKDRIQYMLENYYKFLVVREPLQRLVSGFVNKWVMRNWYYNPKRDKIVKQYRGLSGSLFESFARNIIDHGFNNLDHHWTAYSTLCKPCAINYDFIGKMETLCRDLKYVMNQNHINDTDRYISSLANHSQRAKSKKDSYIKELPDDIYQNLVQKFQLEFELFGYPLPNRYLDILKKNESINSQV